MYQIATMGTCGFVYRNVWIIDFLNVYSFSKWVIVLVLLMNDYSE